MTEAVISRTLEELRYISWRLAALITMLELEGDGLETARQTQSLVSDLRRTKRVLAAHYIQHHLQATADPYIGRDSEDFGKLSELDTFDPDFLIS